MPPWLRQELAAEATQRGHPARYWRELIRRGVREGERNSTIASLTGHLLWRDVDQLAILELLLCWNRVRCQPPLPDAEVVATVESVTRTHRRHAPQI
jgi:hypothetical protein